MMPMSVFRTMLVAVGASLAVACGPSPQRGEMRIRGEHRAYRISVEPAPPHALEPARFRVIVQDRRTGQPIQEGEGRVFATSVDGASAHDGLERGEEVGTYYARLFFVVSGDWAMALQFRADTLERLERVDWTQTVLPAREPGE